MLFDKKFSQLSKDEQRAAKDKYGSRAAWQEAKSKAQGHQDNAAKQAAKAAPPQQAAQNSKALNNEHTPKANDVGVAAKPAPSSSGLRTDGFAKVGADGRPVTVYGAEAEKAKAEFAQKRAQKPAGKPAPQMTAKEQRTAEAQAYQQSRKDMQAARQAGTEGKNTFAVDDTAYYQDQMQKTGAYHTNAQRNDAISGLMSTGQKFGSLDVERELGSNSTHSQDELYKYYGGIENYKNNYSVGSGNYQSRYGQSEYMTSGEAQAVRDQQKSQAGDWLFGDGQEKYGQYDWFKKQQSQFNRTR